MKKYISRNDICVHKYISLKNAGVTDNSQLLTSYFSLEIKVFKG